MSSSHEDGWLTRENALALLLLTVTGTIFYVCYLLVEPFLTGIVFGLAFALFLRTPHRWLRDRIGANSSAVLATLLGAAAILIPVWFVVNQLATEAFTYAQALNQDGKLANLDKTLESQQVGPAVGWIAKTFDLKAELTKMVGAVTSRAPALLGGTIWIVGQFLLTLIVCFYLLRDRHQLLAAGRHLVPLSDPEYVEVQRHLANSVRATVVGSISMGAIQGTLGGIAFWLLGLPAPVVWGVVMAVLAVVPMLGTFVVWVPAALLLAFKGEMAKAMGLAAWGLFAIGMIDNVLYPIVVGDRIRLHPLAVLLSLLGGIALCGTAGLVIGPLVLSLADVLTEIWRRRTRAGQAAENGVTP